MRAGPALAGLGLALLVLGACSREAKRPDVLLVSIERLDWSSGSLAGGPVATPRLAALAAEGTLFQELVSPAPGGPAAALTLISGRSPAEHGLRQRGGAPSELRVPTLGDLFGSRGWHAGVFSQAQLFGGLADVAAGFEAWMMPPESIPLGLPAMRETTPARLTAASAQHWLRGLPLHEPAFAWLHFEAPAMPGMTQLEVASRLAELDSLVGLLVDQLEERRGGRGPKPVLVLTSLSSQGPDTAAALDAGFVLDESVLRVRALALVPGLAPGEVTGLAGLDELHDLLAGVAIPETASRLRDLAAGDAVAREAVLVESQVPMTSLGAQPLLRALRAPGVATPEPDPLVLQALAGDPHWPGGFAGPPAASVLPEWRELRAAAAEFGGTDANAIANRLEPLVARTGGRARAPSLLLALSEARSGQSDRAVERLAALAASAPPRSPSHRQATLALADVERAAGRPEQARELLQALSEQNPNDLTALMQLSLACVETGDSAAALAALQAALESRPRDARVLTAVAGVHSSRGRPDLAAAALADALRQRPVDGSLLLSASDAALEAGDYWTALIRLNRHQEIFGKRADTTHRMGLVYHREERWASAATFHGRALDQDTDYAPARLSLADALLRNGFEDEGRSHLTVARVREPESGRPCGVLVSWLLDAGRADEARAELDSCLRRLPDDAGLQGLDRALSGP